MSSCSPPSVSLLDDMRVGDMGAGHAHHVDMAFGDGAARRGEIGDPRGVEDRQVRPRRLIAPARSRNGRDGKAMLGIDLAMAEVGRRMAADDVEEVDQPAIGVERDGDLAGLLGRARPPACSSPDMRMPMMKSGADRSRIASSISRPKRMRLSRLPPYSSVRWLVAGDQNWSIR